MDKIKVVFLGTPEFSIPVLKSLISDKRIEVMLVVTQPDKPVGRSAKLTPPPVKKIAQENNITIVQPDDINDGKTVSYVTDLEPDFIVVVAYGQILKSKWFKAAKKEILNVHASILPKYRGASPIQAAILNDDKNTGISIMGVRKEMDSGPVYLQKKVAIGDCNFVELSDKLACLGARTLSMVISDFSSYKPVEQDAAKATYCRKIEKNDGLISFKEMGGAEVMRRYKAFYGWPGSFGRWNGKRFIITELLSSPNSFNESPGTVKSIQGKCYIVLKDGSVELKRIKLEGKSDLDVVDFMRGYSSFVGSSVE